MDRRDEPPGRETAAARTRERTVWYGYGHLTRVRKDPVGTFLHDTVRVFGEVSVLSLPALFVVMAYPASGWFDAKATALVAWLTMTLVGTLVRGGWIRPVHTGSPGWVTLAPALLVLRVAYFNLVVLAATFGGLAAGTALVSPSLGLLCSGVVAAVSTLAFPRVAQEVASR